MIFDTLFLIARVLLGLVFVLPGIQVHLVHRADAVQLARANGVPAAALMVPLGGVTVVLGGLMVILGAWADMGALLLAVFALSAAPVMHAFWREQEPMMAQNQMAHFMKNIGLAGGALLVIAVFSGVPNLGLVLTDPLIRF